MVNIKSSASLAWQLQRQIRAPRLTCAPGRHRGSISCRVRIALCKRCRDSHGRSEKNPTTTAGRCQQTGPRCSGVSQNFPNTPANPPAGKKYYAFCI